MDAAISQSGSRKNGLVQDYPAQSLGSYTNAEIQYLPLCAYRSRSCREQLSLQFAIYVPEDFSSPVFQSWGPSGILKPSLVSKYR